MKSIESIPNAARTFDALRSLGYDLNSSVADVVDNAVTEKVKAKNIDIKFDFNTKGQIICRIQDDGSGMGEKQLEEAMRLGTDTSYEEADLGKFGMGMKTASLSHCNKLTIISKKKHSPITAFCWDMTHIKKSGEWNLFQLNQKETEDLLTKENINIGIKGTVVLWDDLYNLNREYKSFSGEGFSQNYFYRKLSTLKLHLRMVYHRFLDGSLGHENTITIKVNGEKLTPWDPFLRSEPNTVEINLKKELSHLKIDGYKKPIVIKAYILPTKEGFSSEEAWKDGKGLNSWNDSQGYYIYRANRIIRFGGWNNTKAKDEHDKLARVSIDIDPTLDELFSITVNKTKVQFPELLFHHLKNNVNPSIIKKAKAQYNKSDEKIYVKNNFRKKESQLISLTKALITENNITTKKSANNSFPEITVENPNGSWLSNKINEFLKYGTNKDFEIISDKLNSPHLWKIICDTKDKFKVIVNASHPFYNRIYRSDTNKQVTAAIDALLFSLAFAELYNKTEDNAHMIDTFKTVCAKTLIKLTENEII
ncbi:MAG: hypothetical protein EKK37_15375 [Sphingobacteriales bacterium]|nr:MAG: hypothetical protein EKK37_15375 [Sphingobacteriales bacterium]